MCGLSKRLYDIESVIKTRNSTPLNDDNKDEELDEGVDGGGISDYQRDIGNEMNDADEPFVCNLKVLEKACVLMSSIEKEVVENIEDKSLMDEIPEAADTSVLDGKAAQEVSVDANVADCGNAKVDVTEAAQEVSMEANEADNGNANAEKEVVESIEGKSLEDEIPEVNDTSIDDNIVQVDLGDEAVKPIILSGDTVDSQGERVVGELNENKKAYDDNGKLRNSSRASTISAHLTSPFTVGKKKQALPPRPAYSFYEQDNRREFYDWFRSIDTKASFPGYDIPLTKDFFNKLVYKNNLLDDVHIAETLYHMRKRVAKEAEAFKGIAIMDWVWFTKFNNSMLQHLKDHPDECSGYLEYFVGIYPTDYGKSWFDGITKVYNPFNFMDKHWVGLEIDLAKHHVRVLDSNIDLFTDVKVAEFLRPLCVMLPIFMKKSNQFSHFGSIDEDFTVSRDRTLSQDTAGGNCGVYTIKYIESFAFGGNLDDLDNQRMIAHREKMCIDLFKQTWIFNPLPPTKKKE